MDTGLADLNAALAARNLKWKYAAELNLDPAESFRIEPFSSGGAFIRGGDVRGLMYGLLEAAEQIRVSGKFAKAHGERGAALRGVRIELDARLEHAPEEFWRSYFLMLARNRINRAHVVFPDLIRPYRSACIVSRAAADAAVDFTLGVAGKISEGEMEVLLALCPAVRSVAVEAGSNSRAAILEAIVRAGRLITVDGDGSVWLGNGVGTRIAPLRAPVDWPPSFEVRVPREAMGENIEAMRAESHELFYWAWGRLAYDANTKPPTGMNVVDYEAVRLATLQIAAAAQADEGGADHVASALEAVHNVKLGIASAKFTPLDIAEHLESSGATLATAAIPDFQAIGKMASERARQQRAAYAHALHEAGTAGTKGSNEAPVDSSADGRNVFYANATSNAPQMTRPQILHKPLQGTASDMPLALTLRIAMPSSPAAKTTPKPAAPKHDAPKSATPSQAAMPQIAPKLTLVRLHYRTLDPQSKETVLEEPASAEVHFTIPGSDLTGNWDLFYYFEVLNTEGSGWFEPDPLASAPYFQVHILAPRTGPN